MPSVLLAIKELTSSLQKLVFSDDSLTAALQAIVDTGRELLAADLAVAFYFNPVTGEFARVTAGNVQESTTLSGCSPPRPGGITRKVMETRSLFVEDLASAEGAAFRSTFSATMRVRSFAAVALHANSDHEAIAVLYLDYVSPRTFTAEDKANLILFADQTALALQSLRLLDGLRKVNATGQQLTRELDSERVLSSIVKWIRTAAQAQLVVLYPAHPTENRLLKPEIDGTLLVPEFPQSATVQPDDIASRTLEQPAALFVVDSSELFALVGGDPAARQGTFEQREGIASTAAIPLKVGTDRVGVLFVNYRYPQRFGEPQKQMIESLATFAAIAIRNSHALQPLRDRHLRQLKALGSVGRSITSKLVLEDVLRAILDESLQLIPAEEASIQLFNNKLQTLETKAAVGANREKSLRQWLVPSEAKGITRWTFENGQIARVGNVHTDPLWRDLYVGISPSVVSEVDVPLLDDGSVLGVMNFESSKPNAFTEQDEFFLTSLAEYAVLAIRNARAYEREKRFAGENAALIEVTKQINIELDVHRILDVILDKALALTDGSVGEVMIYDAERGDLVSLVARGKDTEHLIGRRQALSLGVIGWVATEKRPFVGDVNHPDWPVRFLEVNLGTRSQLVVPLLDRSFSLRGVLSVETTETAHFSERDCSLLEALAELAVIAMHNAESLENAKVVSRRFENLHRVGVELGKITEISDLEEAYDVILRCARQHTDGEVVIRRYDPDSRELVATRLGQQAHIRPFRGISVDEPSLDSQVFLERRSFVVNDVWDPPPAVKAIKLSDHATRSLMVVPIWLGPSGGCYGNLALSHKTPNHFLAADKMLFEGLAQLLALTINRLETVRSAQEAEQRIIALGFMSSIGQSALELAHRLGNDLGTVELSLAEVRAALGGSGNAKAEAERELDAVIASVTKALDLGKRLKKEVAELGAEGASGAAADKREAISIGKLLRDIGNALQPMPARVELRPLDIDDSDAEVLVVTKQIGDILQNLVTNAVDAMPNGGTLTIWARSAGRLVEVGVTDTGTGIALADQPKVFQLFFSTKDSTGFGLWSAQAYAQANGGGLQVKSKPGEGTTFVLSLPRAGSQEFP